MSDSVSAYREVFGNEEAAARAALERRTQSDGALGQLVHASGHSLLIPPKPMAEGSQNKIFQAVRICHKHQNPKVVAVARPLRGGTGPLERQAAVTQSLPEGSHAVRIKQMGEEFTMPLYDGDGEALARRPLPLKKQLHFFADIADGLAAVREKGHSHNDIKPANMFFRMEEGSVRGDLGDFGNSLAIGKRAHGTPFYYDPEQLNQRQTPIGQYVGVDHTEASERYAFGKSMKVFFALAANPEMKVEKLASGFPAVELPQPVQALIDRLMSEDPAKRTGSMTEIATELRALAENQ
jgi:serine/threonine protein kinase